MRHQFIERAREMRQAATPAERKLWYWLRHRYLGGHKFRRQHPIDDYILDFYCAELRLCVEVDGTSHDAEERVRYDAKRAAFLATRGIRILRLRNEHIDEQPDGAWDLILATVEGIVRESRPSPWPSPRAAGRGD